MSHALGKKKTIVFPFFPSGTTGSGAGRPAASGASEATGPSGWRRARREKRDPAKITAATWHTACRKTAAHETGTVARGDYRSRGTRTVCENVQAATHKARLHAGRRRPGDGKALRK